MTAKRIIVVGGGLAGLSSAVALADAGFRIRLCELRPHLGGRASSYTLPDGTHVDNCQHVTMGCCTNLEDFYRRVGAADKIKFFRNLDFAGHDGRRGRIGLSPLAAPAHLAPSFLRFPSLTLADKLSISRAMLAVLREKPAAQNGHPSMLEWLRAQRQTPGAIERFWRVILVSALNEELQDTDAQYGRDVIWKGFLATRRGFEVGVPSVPLGELYSGCRGAIESRGGEVQTRAGVAQIRIGPAGADGVTFKDGREESADCIIAAVPHNALGELLPPGVVDSIPSLKALNEMTESPITGVHFWLDRTVMQEPFLTLLDRTTQWIFNKTLLGSAENAAAGDALAGCQYLQLVISASHGLVEKSREEIIATCLEDVRAVLPEARAAELRKATVIKEAHATFSPRPGSDRLRPPQRSPIANLFLAGDWTATGWPATMEGAVRSGYLAAEEILKQFGAPRRLVVPDLLPEGFAAWFRSS